MFLLSAWLSYRALFTWLNPWGYISTRIIAPVLTVVLFGAIGRFDGAGAQRPVVGGALLAVALAVVYGLALAINNERSFGTLELRILTSEALVPSLLGKALPHIFDGMLGGTLTLIVTAFLFDLTIPSRAVLPLLTAALTAAVSCVGLGVLVAAIGIRTRDTFTSANAVDMALTLLSGVFVAPERLPMELGDLSLLLPLRRSVDAALAAIGQGVFEWQMLGQDLLLGAAWGATGYAFLRWMVHEARSSAAFQLL